MNANQQELAILAQNAKYREQVELMRKIGTSAGFFMYYFEQLKKHRTRIEAFNAVNELHFEMFGELRYSSHQSFVNQLKKYLEK